MNILDIMLGVPMLFLIYKGWRRGLVREATTLLGVLLGIWASVHLSQQVAELLNLQGETAVLIAFFVCFVGALVLAYLLGRSVEKLMKAAKISIVNHVLGAALGLLKALCVLAVLLNYVVMFDSQEALLKAETKENSVLFKPVYNTGNRLTTSLKEYIETHKEEWQEALTK